MNDDFVDDVRDCLQRHMSYAFMDDLHDRLNSRVSR